MNPTTERATAHTPIDNLAAWPFPWKRHNATILAANGAAVARLPCDIEAEGVSDAICGVVHRGDFILKACNANPEDVRERLGKRSLLEGRAQFLEARTIALEKHIEQLIAHWDAAIASEGSEFSNGAFDSVKDTLEDARTLLNTKRQGPAT
jgi:hypothetical protein